MSKPAQNIDLWKQANLTLENIEEELREARFHDDTQSIEYFLKEKRETHALLTKLEKGTKEETL
tara:strand:- start:194 stop:385 length:192 start_codon:yes stop_codon:yes gene_type:complete